MVNLNMTDPNTNCPSGWNLTSSPREHAVKLTPAASLATQSSFPSVEETTPVCVALSEPTRVGG